MLEVESQSWGTETILKVWGVCGQSRGTLAISKRSGGRLVILKVEGGMPAISKDMGGIAAICRILYYVV